MIEYYIRCNGDDIHINDQAPDGPVLDGDWGGEQCEGCGDSIVHSGVVVTKKLQGGTVILGVTCRNCKSTYHVEERDSEA